MLNISEFILKNFRQRVSWSINQNGNSLIKGNADRDEVCDIIKQAKIHIPTDQEIAAKKKKQEEEYMKRKEALRAIHKEEEKKIAKKEKLKE